MTLLTRFCAPSPIRLLTLSFTVFVFSLLLTLGAAHAEASDETSINETEAEVEIMHWWYRGGNARAMRVLKDEFESRGGIWHDVGGTSSEEVLNRAVSRMAKGYAPTLVQWKSPWEIEQIRRLGLLNKANTEMNEFLKDSLIDNLVDMITVDNEIVAVPVNVHSENWLWYRNRRGKNPSSETLEDWKGFLKQAKHSAKKDPSYYALAVGDDPWQQRSLFNNVLLGVAGKERYERLYQQLDVSVLDDAAFIEAATTFQQLSNYSNSFGEGRWDQQVAAVSGNKALAVVLGDFAKGEFKNLGLRLGKDYRCVPAPGTADNILLAMDFFVFGQVVTDSERRGQELFIDVVTDPVTNETFNYLKGSLPPLKEIDEASLDTCNQLAYTTLNKKGSAIRPFESTGDRGLLTKIDHAISQLWLMDVSVKEWITEFESVFVEERVKRAQTGVNFAENNQ